MFSPYTVLQKEPFQTVIYKYNKIIFKFLKGT